MLQLAGVDLVGDNDTREISDFIKKYMPLDSYKPWLTRAYPRGFGISSISQSLGYLTDPSIHINKLYWPTGASRFAYGHFLCGSDGVDQISQAAYGAGGQYNQVGLTIGNPESNDGGTINQGETINCQMYVLPPSPLSGIRGLTNMIQSLYLVTVVDARYFWYYNNVGNISIDKTTTWMSLYNQLFQILNVTPTIDTIDPAYLAPSSQMFLLPYEPVNIVLDAVAFNVGHRIIIKYDGSVATQLYQTALTAFNADMNSSVGQQRLIISGGSRFSSPL